MFLDETERALLSRYAPITIAVSFLAMPLLTFDGLQIVIYVFARVMLAMAKLSIDPGVNPLSSPLTSNARNKIRENAWPAFASLSWASVMYLYRWYPDSVQSSLRSSMKYM